MALEIRQIAASETFELIGRASSSFETNLPMIRYLEERFSGLGWNVSRYPVPDDGPERCNLLCFRSPDPTVLFCAHTDTVPPGDSLPWSATGGKPRQARVQDGRIWGLGSSDNLGSIGLLIAMAQTGRLPDHAAIVFTADEEVGALGAESLLRKWSVPASLGLVVVTEPTNNLVVRGEKGYLPFDVVARNLVGPDLEGDIASDDIKVLIVLGQESHSARPADGRNALFDAAYLDDVEDVAGQTVLGIECRGVRNKVPAHVLVRYAPRNAPLTSPGRHAVLNLPPVMDFLRRMHVLTEEFAGLRDERFRPPEVTLNVGAITARGKDLVFACDLRFLPGIEPRTLLDRIKDEARQTLGHVDFRFPHAPLAPVWNELDNDLLDAIGDRLDTRGKSAYTEAAVFAEAGLTAVIAGPGNLLVHRQDESIALDAFEPGADLFEALAGWGMSRR
jgi:acetylornithine deacetylase/succinyl-diaminopimelate desuccinylase-like protein